MWHAVELREIRVFVALAKELHFGRAAERVGLTQSRVSQSIRDLERKLGVELAVRTSRRVTLTAAGERFLDEVTQALGSLEHVLRSTAEAAHVVTEPLRIGIPSAAAVSPRLQVLAEAYERAYPASPVQFIGLPFRDRFRPLREGAVELMVSTLPLDQPDLVIGPVLSREPRMLAVGRRHPLTGRPTVDVEDLADHAIGELDITAPAELVHEMAPSHTPSGRRIPRVPVAAAEPSGLILAVARGTVVQPVTSQFAATYTHPDVVYVPLAGLPPTRSALIWRRRDRNRALRAFLTLAGPHRASNSSGPARQP
jgi:DNA-binding transcriptional LysR family regulator